MIEVEGIDPEQLRGGAEFCWQQQQRLISAEAAGDDRAEYPGGRLDGDSKSTTLDPKPGELSEPRA